jgi:hypothetical protein
VYKVGQERAKSGGDAWTDGRSRIASSFEVTFSSDFALHAQHVFLQVAKMTVPRASLICTPPMLSKRRLSESVSYSNFAWSWMEATLATFLQDVLQVEPQRHDRLRSLTGPETAAGSTWRSYKLRKHSASRAKALSVE